MPINNKNINTAIGWLMFAAAAVVLIMTTEPTASLWDCPEYIATAVRLEVGHPPGAPLFQMLGAVIANMFSVELTGIAFVMNVFSCLAGAVSVMLLFWVITYFAKKIAGTDWDGMPRPTAIAVFASGIVGSAAILFSDTFWFNSTESEVYALATTFTVLMLYLAIRWESGFGKERNNKWLLAIALLIGFGPGVHFMVLLGIPVVVLTYYFKTTEKITRKGFILANLAAAGVLLLVFAVIFPLLLGSYGSFEIFMVNSLGLPFHSGTILLTVIIASAFGFGAYYTQKKQKPYANTIVLSLAMIVIGFSCYLMLPIRSNARTPINENDPATAVGLLSYFNRTQYGSSPTIYGPMYNARPDYSDPYKLGSYIYQQNMESGKYEKIDREISIRYVNGKGLFPRIHSNRAEHAQNYRNLTGLKEGQVPNLFHNIYFFLDYQLGYMNLRYLLWNFSGRQNDFQGTGEPHKGNWITGISFIDKLIYGQGDTLAPDYLKNNRANNKYYMLPLILAIIGMFFHARRDDKSFWNVLVFFIITGIAITLYTNNPPYEPRERDYAICVSFWAFGIWLGLGVFAIADYFNKLTKQKKAALLNLAVAIVCFIAVPLNMAAENWDDHDRRGRSTAHMVGHNYLSCVGKNGIMVTYGDNDTFPLWYMQEVEHYRTDVRVVNTSLLMVGWYINQMREKYYESDALPLTLPEKMYRGKTNESVYFLGNLNHEDKPGNQRELINTLLATYLNKSVELKELIEILKAQPQILLQEDYMGNYDIAYPIRNITIPVNRENAVKYGIVAPEYARYIQDSITIKIGDESRRGNMDKKDLAFLDFLSTYQWDRPIHFAVSGTGGDSENNFFWLNDYLIKEGMTLKLVPFEVESLYSGELTADGEEPDRPARASLDITDGKKSYELIRDFEYGGVGNPKVYLTESDRRATVPVRSSLTHIATALTEEGDTLRARELLATSLREMPMEIYEPSFYSMELIDALYQAGDFNLAREKAEFAAKQIEEEVIYLLNFPPRHRGGVLGDCLNDLRLYNLLLSYLEKHDMELHKTKQQTFEQLYMMYKNAA